LKQRLTARNSYTTIFRLKEFLIFLQSVDQFHICHGKVGVLSGVYKSLRFWIAAKCATLFSALKEHIHTNTRAIIGCECLQHIHASLDSCYIMRECGCILSQRLENSRCNTGGVHCASHDFLSLLQTEFGKLDCITTYSNGEIGVFSGCLLASLSISQLSTLMLTWCAFLPKYPSSNVMRFGAHSSVTKPRAVGSKQNILLIPSMHLVYGNFAMVARDAKAPFWSCSCIGLAPGAKGSLIALPYTMLLVMVTRESVAMASWYSFCLSSFSWKRVQTWVAMLSI